MKALPPIPTPTAFYWREFRVRVMPVFVFVLIMASIVVLWRYSGLNGGIPGVAEGVRSIVSSPQPGMVQQLKVQPYEMVQAGQPIAIVRPQDPRGQLDLLAAELQLARMRFQPTLAEENAMNYERIRIDLLRTQAEVAVAKVKLVQAESDVKRWEDMVKRQLMTQDAFETGLGVRDALRAEVEEKSKAAKEIARSLDTLRNMGVPQPLAADDPMQSLFARLESMKNAAQTNWNPVTLVAPISGMVSVIYRQAGESVVEGEPLILINSLWSDRVVGYMRQPFPIEPKPGMKVTVTTRDTKRVEFQSEISQVGAQIETITNVLAFIRTGALIDAGLPIVVNLPRDISLRPGEVVDIMIAPQQAERAPAATQQGAAPTGRPLSAASAP